MLPKRSTFPPARSFSEDDLANEGGFNMGRTSNDNSFHEPSRPPNAKMEQLKEKIDGNEKLLNELKTQVCVLSESLNGNRDAVTALTESMRPLASLPVEIDGLEKLQRQATKFHHIHFGILFTFLLGVTWKLLSQGPTVMTPDMSALEKSINTAVTEGVSAGVQKAALALRNEAASKPTPSPVTKETGTPDPLK